MIRLSNKLAGIALLWTIAYTLGAASEDWTFKREVNQLRHQVELAEAYRLVVGIKLRSLENDLNRLPPLPTCVSQ